MTHSLTPEEFETLFRRFHAGLCDVAYHITASHAEAEEVVQELFLKLWLQRDNLEIHDSISSYLFASARNNALTVVRRRIVALRAATAPDVRLGVSEAETPVLERIERAESLERLQGAVANLPERSRLALRLRWLHGLSYRDVASSMGISEKGVEKLLSIAMRHLRRELLEPVNPSGQPPPGVVVTR